MWYSDPDLPYKISRRNQQTNEKDPIGAAHSLISAMDTAQIYISRHSLADRDHTYEIIVDGPEFQSWSNSGEGWSKL